MGLPKRTALITPRPPDFDAPASIFDLFNYVIFELLAVTGSLVTRMCEAEHGVTRDEWQIVAMLATLGSTGPTELAARTTMDASQLSRTLQRMCAKGLVRREPVAGDARRVLIALADGGHALYAAMFPRVVELNRKVLAGLSGAERRTLADILYRLRADACDVVAATPLRAKINRRRRSAASAGAAASPRR